MVHTRSIRDSGSERAQSTFLVIAALTVVGAAVAALFGLTAELVARGRLQTTADIAALAGVAGRPAASEVTTRNGARLIDLTESDGVVTVTVERDGRRAVASATDVPPSTVGRSERSPDDGSG